MPTHDGVEFTDHGWDQAVDRNISTGDIRWAMGGSRRAVEEGKTLCQRWYNDDNGDRWGIFVILNSDGAVITTWVREG